MSVYSFFVVFYYFVYNDTKENTKKKTPKHCYKIKTELCYHPNRNGKVDDAPDDSRVCFL